MTEKGSNEEAVVFRNNLVTVFIAGKWWRTNPGHVIIIPNAHVENIYDLPEEIGHAVFDLSKRVAIALKETYICDGVSTKQHNEPAGNQEVWHYHFHVIPRYVGDDHYLKGYDMYWPTMDEKRPYAEKLRAFLKETHTRSHVENQFDLRSGPRSLGSVETRRPSELSPTWQQITFSVGHRRAELMVRRWGNKLFHVAWKSGDPVMTDKGQISNPCYASIKLNGFTGTVGEFLHQKLFFKE
jgi:histidine triad (HIT) family protein